MTGASAVQDRVSIVTGGNAGIGKAIAASLAQQPGRVVIVSRDPRKGQEAVAEIQASNPVASVEMVEGDLGSVRQVRQLAAALLARYPRIQVLINNAGVWLPKRVVNEDGLELSFMVNHLAPFLLTNLLLDRLQASAPARIVNVNAGLYIKGTLDLEKTPYGHDFHRLKSYANTKLCNVLFTVELARRLVGTGVTVNAVHPGVIRTGLGDTSGPIGWLLRLVKRFWPEPVAGARAPVWLATDPALEGVSGKYFDLQTETELTETARDEVLARQLWELSTKLAGLPVTV
jgi:NAD(P)-dependent dehydrogenase (short-subunit alcohol dehydrogenase family)